MAYPCFVGLWSQGQVYDTPPSSQTVEFVQKEGFQSPQKDWIFSPAEEDTPPRKFDHTLMPKTSVAKS